jgi:DNA-binding response OmpR family regulator
MSTIPPLSCFCAKLFLEASGFQVVVAPSGADGLECFKKHSIDAVVAEIAMAW